MNTRSVLVLGSTGSVGTQALDLIADHPDRFTVAGLAAGGRDLALLGRQIREHGVRRVAVTDPAAAVTLRRSLPGMGLRGVEVWSGPDAAAELTAASGADVVLNAITGSVGLGPTLAALRSGATLALANKESLVAGGALVTGAAAPGQIVPGRLGALGAGPVPARRPVRGGGPAGADRVRGTVPGPAPRRAGRRHGRGGAGPPDLGDGPDGHHQLGHADQQGAGADRGAPAVRRALRADRRGGAPAVDRALDGHLRRRVDAGPGQPAGHDAAHRAGPGLAGAGPGRGAAVPLGHRAELDLRAARRRRVPRGPAGPGRRRRPAGACPPC